MILVIIVAPAYILVAANLYQALNDRGDIKKYIHVFCM